MAQIVQLDPFSGIDKAAIKKKLQEEEEGQEQHSYETRDNIFANLSEEDFDALVQERYTRINLEKEKAKMTTKLEQIQQHQLYLEQDKNEAFDNYSISKQKHEKTVNRIEKLKHNIEIIIQLKQG